jgi:hypothetical protein
MCQTNQVENSGERAASALSLRAFVSTPKATAKPFKNAHFVNLYEESRSCVVRPQWRYAIMNTHTVRPREHIPNIAILSGFAAAHKLCSQIFASSFASSFRWGSKRIINHEGFA